MRMRLIFGIITIFWIILLTRIYYLSIKSNKYYEEIAEQNAVKTELIAPVRGNIYDIKGRPLAVNRLGFSISIKPHISNKEEILDDEINAIVSLFGDLNATKIKKDYKKNDSPYNQDFIEVVDFIDYDAMLPHFAKLVLRHNLLIKPASKRHYPNDNIASHVIGYVGRANLDDYNNDPMTKLTNYTGRNGVERYYNSVLQGINGERKTKVTALNKEVEEISYTKPRSQDIKLTIDLDLQKYIYENFEHRAGAIIVMDLNDGAILSAVSFPEYNLNPFVTGISYEQWNNIVNSLDHPFTNKLVNGLYPPASTIKMASAMAFLDSGKMTKDDGFFCSGSFELGGRKFRCWKSSGHGFVNLNDAIKYSCDDYFYKGSFKVGIDEMVPIYEKFGFGYKTNVDLPNEFVGTVPSRSWKKQKTGESWYQGDTLITSIGQGSFLVTPMQMAKFIGALATNKNITPHFLDSIDGQKVKFEVTDLFIDPKKIQNLSYVKKAMKDVANSEGGTALRVLSQSNVTLGTKTGTAQVVGIPQSEKVRMKEADMEYYQRSHAWMTTFGPYEEPKYAVIVLVEHGQSGGRAGGPITVKIFNKLVEMGYIDKKFLKQNQKK
ncbi:penicillin-binding protein 2 [Campylobacter sputorum subsp. bubulus]|uniref:Penicillin-binding protein 2 n=1 Tax=Campylobacter sputorum subsp. sputorum TaxID=32024 RepID=A0A381DJI7_9BACT|nr:penicillin-binding protein 2 [Campylobacter sputorum]ASM35681.1 penicillin-binding protein 2 [Campylobacter sputorum aubsp. sputorum RM3237]KAB0582589.1 penicillin-binding protein 2 [Campylobacter sputorum subsp. sputorum]QEL05873.1 penicillin-binding protein 2 [Campylobacter sputorum subsp. sputorum]SUX07893.1 penicillin-binding protein 2 [Campylobacter sputorum subsp. bubulus]SUX10651.1 penicillin-binding protein 2 [Campylobacter sputorum subsp. sputorum]